MDLEILRDRADVEPSSFVQDYPADLAFFSDPLREDGNKRRFFVRWNALENRGVPDGDARKIQVAFHSVLIANVDHATISQSDIGPQPFFAQR